ncbi:MAG: hypothetical protein OXN83_00900 [Oligoflexia bacterium]|nr:hypothetical protein [Oligoflexia bacterium]
MFIQNYIQFSLNKGNLSIKIFPPKGEIQSPAREAEKAAFYFYQKYKKKKIILCLSGGLDSLVMAESFLKANAPFSAVIWRYKNNLNAYDIKHAFQFCRQNKIDYEIEELDLESFYGNHLHFYYGIKYLCDSPQIAVHLYFLEQLAKRSDRAFFLPWQPPEFWYTYTQGIKNTAIKIFIAFRYLAYYRFFLLNKTAGSAYFMISHSALLYSFLKLPLVKFIMNHKNKNILKTVSPYKLKTILYKQGGFTSKPLKGKFTGFDQIRNSLSKKYGEDYYNKAFRFPLMKTIPPLKQQDLYLYPIWKN